MKIGTGIYINEREILEQELSNYKDKIISKYKDCTDVRFQWKDDQVVISWEYQGWCMDKDETMYKTIILDDEQIETIKAFNKLIQYYK